MTKPFREGADESITEQEVPGYILVGREGYCLKNETSVNSVVSPD